jgi:predicted  nucleic acid-binding Zn-ribbon protein
MKYNWPETKFARKNTLDEQLEHVLSEAKEVKDALKDKNSTVFEIESEIADLHHSIETYFRILERYESQHYVDHLIESTRHKNDERGYYA